MNATRPDARGPRERSPSAWRDYAVAGGAVTVAIGIRLALDTVLGDVYPFITCFGAVACVAWFGRTSAALFALVVSGLASVYLFVPPRFALDVFDPNAMLGLGLYFAMAGVVVGMGHAMRGSRSRAEHLLVEATARQEALRQAVAAETEQRERLRITLASIGDAVITTDTAGRITSLNAAGESLTGWTCAEATGQSLDAVFRIVNETTREPIEDPAANHRALIGKDGTERPIDDSAAPIRSATGEVIGSVLVFRDVTARHVQEAGLRESEARFRELADALPQMVYESDAQGRVVYASRQWLDYTGQRDAQTADLSSVVHPDDLGEMVRLWDEARNRGTTLQAEFRLRRAEDQAYRWFLTRSLPVRDTAGRIIKWFGTSTDIHEQKETARRLAESEALYRGIGESINFGVWVCDAEGRNTYASESFLRLVGLTQQECADSGWGNVLHPDDAEATMAAWKECVRTKGAWDRTHRFRAVDGQWYYVLARGVPLRNAAGDAVGWAGINLDVTHLVETEQEVVRLAAESDRQGRLYETVLTNTPDFMYVFSLDHRVLYANDALIKMWGRGYEGAIGKTFLEIGYEPWHAAMHDREIDQVRATRQPIRGEVPFTGTSGRRQYDYIFVPVIGADGEVEAVAGTTRDVTERKETERALQAGEERLRTALTAARMVAWEWTPSDRRLRVSENAADVLGVPAGVGLTGIDQGLALVHPDDVAAYKDTFRRAIRSRTGYRTRYRVIRPDDGRVIWIEERGETVCDQPDAGMRLFGVSMDVTDRHEAETERERLVSQLRDQDRRKDEFLATLAHELRNPLAPILTGLQLLRMAGADGTVEQVRSMMERQLGQMTRLVDDLLDVSRVTSGKLQLRRKPIELATVIHAAVETSLPAIEQAGHQITITMPDVPVIVDGDEVRLAQVVSNLLTNSARYTHDGGQIRVTVRLEDGMAVVIVADDGIGIPPTMLEAVFGMFTQVDRALERTTGGLGIGLSLARGLVEMHGGAIEAHSEGDGRGSEFVVRLPVATRAPDETEPAELPPIDVRPSGGRRVLVVDDNVDAADLLAQLLELLGAEVRVAHDGDAGIAVAEAFRPSIVLCDIGMPKVNGYDVARCLRAEAWGRAMVLVALTGWGQDDDRQRSADAGFDRHLVKPVDDTALMELLAGLAEVTD